ncbi:MAG: D-alanine--D-alanine ligase [Nitrospirota bacterium]
MDKKKLKRMKIGVLMGGKSSEREVSLKSGEAIFKALKSLQYDAVRIDAGDNLCADLKKRHIDIAFLALHGGHGENGAVQGMLEVLGIPYTGSGILASALAMDKEASKKIFLYHGIPVPPFKIVQKANDKGQRAKKYSALCSMHSAQIAFPLPWVVKPACEGSSVGVEIVKDRAKFKKALYEAFAYDNRVIVEKYIDGKEIQIGILNNKVLGGVEVRPSLEFYNYRAKYTPGLTEYVLPPRVGKRVYERAAGAALSAHMALGCSGATRVDLRVDNSGKPYVLEVNTIPGMTETSLLPKIARQAGFDFQALIDRILGDVDET